MGFNYLLIESEFLWKWYNIFFDDKCSEICFGCIRPNKDLKISYGAVIIILLRPLSLIKTAAAIHDKILRGCHEKGALMKTKEQSTIARSCAHHTKDYVIHDLWIELDRMTD